MRNLIEVMQAVLNQVPGNHASYGPLSRKIESITDSIPYTAPEALGIRWREFSETLGFMYQNLDTDWTRMIGKIMRGEVDYKEYMP